MPTLDVYRALWRHKLFIVILTAAMGAGTWFAVSHEKPTYQATTLVRIQQRVSDAAQAFGALQTGQLLAETYAQIVEADSVRQRIFRLVHEQIPRDTGEITISGSAVSQLDLLRITAQSHDPRQATEVANAAPIALARFINDTGTLRDQIVTVDQARLPTSPVAPHVKLDVALAIVLGLMVNGALALLLEFVNDPLPDPNELERLFDVPVLATIPSLRLRSPLATGTYLASGRPNIVEMRTHQTVPTPTPSPSPARGKSVG